jgi:membrane protein DedA with SNARE-associated domain
MESYYSVLVDFSSAHLHFAYAIIFLLAFSEAIPVIGTFVPGSTLVFAISALATRGGADPWLLLLAATSGAIAGDGISFWLGQTFSREILTSWPLAKYPHFIDQSEKFIAKYGAYAVFLARFTAVVRAFVPLVAGILLMPPRRFYAANILSAIAWAPAHVFPGVVLAMATQMMGAMTTERIVVAVAVLVAAGVIVFFLHRWVKAKAG